MRVLMVGTSLDAPGGVAAVLRTWRDAGLFERAGIRFIATNEGRGALGKGIAALRAWFACAAAMLFGRVALVHVHTSSYASFWRKTPVFACALLLGKPLVVSLHGGAFREFYAERGALGRAWIRLVMRRARRFVVLTESWRRWAMEIEPRANVCVIPNTVAPVRARSSAESEAVRGPLLFLGRIEREKGIFVLVQALARAHAAGAAWRLVCGGTGEVEAVRRAMQQARLPDEAIEFRGWVGGEQKAALLDQCALLVLPSLIENMPVSVLEAFAHGKPVIATRVGGIPDMVIPGSEGLLVPPGDAGALAAALIEAWHSPAEWRARGVSARERFQRDYACDAVVARVEALYGQCLGSARPDVILSASEGPLGGPGVQSRSEILRCARDDKRGPSS
jgi:glycosyltransferase involved in cell wall biosynthesis